MNGTWDTKGGISPRKPAADSGRRAPVAPLESAEAAANVAYLARVGHELRTPLATMMTLSRLLDGSTGALTSTQKTYMDVKFTACGSVTIATEIRAGSVGEASVGSGLGPAISRTLVTHMGGKLRATSKPGAGSRFSFTSPRQPRQTRDKVRSPGQVPRSG